MLQISEINNIFQLKIEYADKTWNRKFYLKVQLNNLSQNTLKNFLSLISIIVTLIFKII